MRILWRALGLGALVAAGLIWTNGALRASDAPVVHVKAEVKDGAVRLQAEANAPFEYTTYRPSDSLYVLDLSGVSAGDPAGARVVASDLVKSYRVITYVCRREAGRPARDLAGPGSRATARAPGQGRPDPVCLARRLEPRRPARCRFQRKRLWYPRLRRSLTCNLAAHQAIRQVHLAQNGTTTEVSISGSGPLTYHSIHLQNPDRLVLDFAGSHLTTTEKADRQQSRSGAGNPAGTVHAGGLARGD